MQDMNKYDLTLRQPLNWFYHQLIVILKCLDTRKKRFQARRGEYEITPKAKYKISNLNNNLIFSSQSQHSISNPQHFLFCFLFSRTIKFLSIRWVGVIKMTRFLEAFYNSFSYSGPLLTYVVGIRYKRGYYSANSIRILDFIQHST